MNQFEFKGDGIRYTIMNLVLTLITFMTFGIGVFYQFMWNYKYLVDNTIIKK